MHRVHRVEVVPEVHGGRKVISRAKLAVGDVALTASFVGFALVHSERERRCQYCFVELSVVRRCSGCQYARYCDDICAKADWKRAHKMDCGRLKGLSKRDALLDANLAEVALLAQVVTGDRKDPLWQLYDTLETGECGENE